MFKRKNQYFFLVMTIMNWSIKGSFKFEGESISGSYRKPFQVRLWETESGLAPRIAGTSCSWREEAAFVVRNNTCWYNPSLFSTHYCVPREEH